MEYKKLEDELVIPYCGEHNIPVKEMRQKALQTGYSTEDANALESFLQRVVDKYHKGGFTELGEDIFTFNTKEDYEKNKDKRMPVLDKNLYFVAEVERGCFSKGIPAQISVRKNEDKMQINGHEVTIRKGAFHLGIPAQIKVRVKE